MKSGKDTDTDRDIFERLAAENAQVEAQLKALAAEQRAELDALFLKLQEQLAGIRIPPPSIVAEPGRHRK